MPGGVQDKWCEGGDSNPHILRTLTPEASASTNSATFAQLPYFFTSTLLLLDIASLVRGGGLEPPHPKDTNT